MKLATFAVAGRDRVGAVVDKHVVDLNAAYAASLGANSDPESAARAGQALPAGQGPPFPAGRPSQSLMARIN